MSYNQNELVKYLKKKRKFMTAKQIAKELKSSQQTVNRKLKKLAPKIIERKKRKIDYGDQKRHVNFYRVRRKNDR